MIIAGIDEAGYGPLLGPLVVGCCAFEVADDDPTVAACVNGGTATTDPSPSPTNGNDSFDEVAVAPCLWKRLNKYVSRNRIKNGRKLQVNDSKIVYAPVDGLKELERATLALLATAGPWVPTLDDLLARVGGDECPEHARGYPWYGPAPNDAERFPLEQADLPIRLFAKALGEHMDHTRTRLVRLRARVVFERQFNQMLDATRNKGSALFSISAVHLDDLLRSFGDRRLLIVCDRQGGREHYGSLLRLMFPEWSLEILREQDGYSDYRLLRDGPGGRRDRVRLIFREKAEVNCLCVAAASMLSKYLREVMMRRFNAYWRQFLPDLAPTAGYYGDGARFLSDIEAKRRELGVPDEQLIRCR